MFSNVKDVKSDSCKKNKKGELVYVTFWRIGYGLNIAFSTNQVQITMYEKEFCSDQKQKGSNSSVKLHNKIAAALHNKIIQGRFVDVFCVLSSCLYENNCTSHLNCKWSLVVGSRSIKMKSSKQKKCGSMRWEFWHYEIVSFILSIYDNWFYVVVSFNLNCEGSFLPRGYSVDQSSEKRSPLWGRDRLSNDPQWSPGFLNYCSWMFPERLRNKSELVGSEETRQVLTRHPRYVTPFC